MYPRQPAHRARYLAARSSANKPKPKPSLGGGLNTSPNKKKKKKGNDNPANKLGKKGGKTAGGKGLSAYFKNWDALAPLEGKTLQRELNAADRLAHKPLARQLGAEMRGSENREQNEIPAWYKDYRNEVARLRGESAAEYDRASKDISAFSQQAGAQDSDNREAMMKRLQSDAAIRGGGVEQSVESDNANASNARQALLSTVHGAIRGQGANQYANMTNRQAIGHMREREEQKSEHQRQLGISEKQRDLAKSRGDFRVDFLRQRREDERRYHVEKAAARTDKFEAREAARANRADERQDARNESGRNYRARLAAITSKMNTIRNNIADAKSQEDRQRFERQLDRLKAQRDAIQAAKDRRHDSNEGAKDRKADKKNSGGKKKKL
jgi:hypothetical protein